MAFRERRRTALLLLKNIEKKLTNGEESQASTGKKNSSNKRLVGQGGERACLEVADFGDELIERLSFRIDFVAHQAKSSQIIERSFAQLLSRASEQNGAAQRPRGGDGIDQDKTGRPRPVIKKGRASDNQQGEDDERVPNQRRHHLRALSDEKNLVIGRKFLFGERWAAVTRLDHAASPLGDFAAKHANEITVQLYGIDHVKGEE